MQVKQQDEGILIIKNSDDIYVFVEYPQNSTVTEFLELDPHILKTKAIKNHNQVLRGYVDYDRKVAVDFEDIKIMRSKSEELFDEWLFNIVKLHKFVPKQHIKDTPHRISKMYVDELFAFYTSPTPKLTVFKNENGDTPVIMKDVKVKSLCAHHFMPFYGLSKIAYVADENIVGLSKLPRIIEYFASKPGVQEELTIDTIDYLNKIIKPKAIYFHVECMHLCMTNRGVESDAITTTERFIGKEEYRNMLTK